MLEKLKSLVTNDAYFYSLLLVLVATASFGLGMRSTAEQNQSISSAELERVQPAALVPQVPTDLTKTTQSAAVVASKSGSKYHLPTCSGAKQIKESNKIIFDTVAAAEAAGYTPAANCDFN